MLNAVADFRELCVIESVQSPHQVASNAAVAFEPNTLADKDICFLGLAFCFFEKFCLHQHSQNAPDMVE